MTIPDERFYTSTHEWVQQIEDGMVLVGITDHAQQQLGDLVYIELPDELIKIHAGDELGIIESVKTAADFYSPVTGDIVEINEDVAQSPAIVNKDAYGDGWLVKIKLRDPGELEELLDAQGYAEFIAEEE